MAISFILYEVIILIHSAIIFASKAHCNQLRKGTDLPYIIHPLEVAQILTSFAANDEVIIAGLLHDVLEDTFITATDIKQNFGQNVLDLVVYCTDNKKLSWKKRKMENAQKLRTANKDLALLIAADKLSNLRSIHYDFKQEIEKTWERFSKGKEDVIWYYSILNESIQKNEFLPFCLKKEFEYLLNDMK